MPDGAQVSFPDDMSADQIRGMILQKFPDAGKAPQPAFETGDVLKSAGEGLKKGTIALGSMGGDIRELAMNASEYLSGKIVGPEKAAEAAKAMRPIAEGVGRFLPLIGGNTTAQNTKAVEPLTGPEYTPQTTAGRYAKGVGEFLPGATLPGGSVAARLASSILGGAGSVAGGDLAQAELGAGAKPYGELAGAIMGGLSPNVLSRAVTPVGTSAARQRLVDTLTGEGVTSLTAGQRTGNKAVQYAESILGDAPGAGQGAARVQEQGQRQFTEAVMRRAGAGPTAQPEVLAENNARLGREFQGLSARNNVAPDNQFITELTDAVRNYRRVPDSQQRAMVQGYVDDLIDHVNAGSMPGPQYQEMRSRLSRQANSLRNSDPTLSEALRDMRNALDNAMRRSISPADSEAWDTARRQYGAQKDIEKAASRAGEATAEGQVTPANIRNVAAANNRGAYARGEGEFSELARAGSGVMAPLPNSGTGQRVAIHSILTALGGGAGSVAGPGGSLLGAAAGAVAPAAAGRALMSAPVQRYLGNNLIDLDRLPPAQRAIAAALLGHGDPTLQLRGPVDQSR